MKWRKWSVFGVLFAIVSLFTLQPSMWVAAQGYSWTGEYYNNSYLQGSPAFTRTDNVLAFDFGNNAPGNGVGADGFSVRWTALAAFGGGTYRFYALADDNIKITLDDGYTPILNTFGGAQIGQTITADVPMTAGVHKVRVDYQEVSGSAYAYVTWASLSSNPTGPNFPVPQVSYSNINNGAWTVQYFNNTALSGSPVVTQNEGGPSHNWGSGAPVNGLPVDNFSARWTSTQGLDAANYQLSVSADDGVRVFVDGNLVINEFHGATTTTYTANLNLGAGNHTIVVEYYEGGGNAFLNYNLNRVTSNIVSPPTNPNPVNTGTTATVTAARLNVRDNPSATATIILKINRNEVYPVVGKNGDSSWYQISVNGVNGWVSSRFVTIGGNQPVNVVSQSQSLAQPVDTGFNATALTTVNVRNAPNTRGTQVLAKMQRNNTARIIGRTANNSWWQVNFNGVVGWVSSTFARIQGGAVVAQIPITG